MMTDDIDALSRPSRVRAPAYGLGSASQFMLARLPVRKERRSERLIV